MYKKKAVTMIPCGFCGTLNPNKKWCGNKCSSNQWRLDHPRTYAVIKTENICGFDGQDRSKPHIWKKFMVMNPIYANMVLR
jgi:hypothetical protein